MFGEVLETWTTATRYGFWPKKRVSLLSIVLLGQLVPKPRCYSSISLKDIVLNARNIAPLPIVLFLYYVLHRLGLSSINFGFIFDLYNSCRPLHVVDC